MIRIGIGHDTHRLEAGDTLTIGGVSIPHEKGFVAHSDGDVLLHALIDAVVGALGWGDIGEWFPDTDPQHKGADSKQLTSEVMRKVQTEGWVVGNIDAIIFAQQPKLSIYKEEMEQQLAKLTSIEPGQVNVKAKTGEKVGPVGREEAISAQVAVLMVRE